MATMILRTSFSGESAVKRLTLYSLFSLKSQD